MLFLNDVIRGDPRSLRSVLRFTCSRNLLGREMEKERENTPGPTLGDFLGLRVCQVRGLPSLGISAHSLRRTMFGCKEGPR